MGDIFSRRKRSAVMAAIRSRRNLATEMRLAALLRASGISGWRRQQKLPGNPDFVFRRERVAVFVDGCFWHCCPMHGRIPTTNEHYWIPKLARNKRRDRMVSRSLKQKGWRVVRIWYHELSKERRVVTKVRTALRR